MKPARSVLDSELMSMAREAAQGQPALAALPFDSLGGRMRAAGALEAEAATSETVTLKLVVDPGAADQVAQWVQSNQGRVSSHGQGVLVADLSVRYLKQLDRVSGVRRAEASRILHPTLQDARGPVTGLDAALQTHGLTGEGVVVGVVDTGVDYAHDDFRNEDGSTRLAWFGHAQRPPNSSASQFAEFGQADIQATVDASGPVPTGDPVGHGTHCASIAAGNGRASGGDQRGVAQRASIMAARCDPLADAHVIWAIRRMFAEAGPRPCVINCSFGGHWGPHDGTSAIEDVLARETGPGRIIVVAAGNEQQDQIHAEGRLEVGQDLVIPFRIGDQNGQFVDAWVPRGDDVEIEIEDPSGARFPADGNIHQGLFGRMVADWLLDPVNLDQNLNIRVVGSPVNSIWRIRLTPVSVTQGNVHAWSGTVDPNTARNLFPNTLSPDYSIGMPATEERAIAVGAFVSQVSALSVPTPGLTFAGLAPFSSHGPTRLGVRRPDITAPGQYITAALAADSAYANDPRLAPRRDPGGRYITIQGTSMAAPFVAGVIALMLEREPDLDPAEIRQRLRVTAQRDALTGPVWNPGFGFGRIGVQALLDYSIPAV